MSNNTLQLRQLLKKNIFLHLPSVSDPLQGRLVESLGFEAVFIGGYVSGASSAITEPLMTMTEQVKMAQDITGKVNIPLIADAGAGWGDSLHTMRTVSEFIRAGVAGLHIEDQVFPKRAHYHKYVVHGISREEYIEKISYACKERDRLDPHFVIIARTDTCRSVGLDEAVFRINAAADVGADLGLLFPRNVDDAIQAPKRCKIPLIYVQSRGNRDGRPLFTRQELIDMGYVACIEAQVVLCSAFHFMKKMLTELRETGEYKGLTNVEFVTARQDVEDIISLTEFYEIEANTVEKRQAS
jgi:methylisocitrate lyase